MTEEHSEQKPKKAPKSITKPEATALLRDGDKHGIYCFLTLKKVSHILGLTDAERLRFEEDPQAFGIKKTLSGSEPLYGFLIEDLEAVRGNMDPSNKKMSTVSEITLAGHVSSPHRPTKNLRVR